MQLQIQQLSEQKLAEQAKYKNKKRQFFFPDSLKTQKHAHIYFFVIVISVLVFFFLFFVLFTLHWLQPPRGNSFAFLHMLARTHTHQNLLPHTPPQGNQVLINGRMANKSHKQMMKLFCVYRRIPLPAPTMQTTHSHAASCRCLNALQPVTGCLQPWHLSPFLRQPGILSGDTFHTSRCCASMSCVVIVVKRFYYSAQVCPP